MKKRIILLMTLFLLTGCTAKYDIKINLNNSVEDNFYITVEQTVLKFDDMGGTPEGFVKALSKTINNKSEGTAYKIETIIDNFNMGLTTKKTYRNIDSFVNATPLASYLYDGLKVTRNGSHIILESFGNVKKAAIYCDLCGYPNLKNSYLAIRLPYKVTKSNASRVDGSKNIYYWNINYNDYPNNIYFEYDSNVLYTYNIIDLLPFINPYLFIIAGFLIIVIITFIILNSRRKKANII